MKRWCNCSLIMLLCAVTGCSTSKQSARRYPAPIFDTKPAPQATPVTPAVQPQLTRRPSAEPGWIPPGGVSSRWTEIVLHHSGSQTGNAAAFDAYHRRVQKWDELGYHFVIGNGQGSRDGQVEVGSRWRKQKHGAHCKTPNNHYNDHGIGICLVGDFDHHQPTAAQMASLNRLLRFLMAECHIPISRIHTHKGVTHKTACPGRNLDLATVRGSLDDSGRRYSTAISRN